MYVYSSPVFCLICIHPGQRFILLLLLLLFGFLVVVAVVVVELTWFGARQHCSTDVRPMHPLATLTPHRNRFPLPTFHTTRRNAAIYGVENRIEFILGDAMKVLPTLKADAVFLSPPWGGPEYSASATFDLDTMIPPPLSALDIFRAARQVTDNVVFFLPRNVDVDQVAGLPAAAAAADTVGDSAGDSARAEAEEGAEEGEEGDGLGVGAGVGEALENCELEKQFLNGKLKTTTAYFGRDIVAVRRDKRGAKNGAKNGAKSDAKNGGGEAWSEGNVPAAPPNSATTVEWNEGEQGGDGSSKGGRGAVWSGRHVRFSDDADTKGLTSGHEQDQQDQQDPVLNSRSRENALYESWMAAAATG